MALGFESVKLPPLRGALLLLRVRASAWTVIARVGTECEEAGRKVPGHRSRVVLTDYPLRPLNLTTPTVPADVMVAPTGSLSTTSQS